MKARKLIALILCAIMSLSLVACNKDTRTPNGGSNNKPNVNPTVKYTVTFDPDGGSVSPTSIQVVSGETLGTSLPVPTKEGFLFNGWYTVGGSQFKGNTSVTGDITVKAKWKSQEEQDAEASAYEDTLTAANGWQAGHLYLHYKRYDHTSADEFDWTSNGPEYTTPIAKTNTYSDWGLWAWPKNDEGRLFRPAKVDVSGAIYDIKLDQDYNDAGWDNKNKVQKTNKINYKTNQGNPVKVIGTQLISISSRTEGTGFWANDGGDKDLVLADMVRSDGSYHWFVTQGNVGKGTKSYSTKVLKDPYKGLATGAAKTRTSGDQMINSAADSTFSKVNSRVKGWDDDAVGYQIFVASFCDSDGDGMGDIPGIISKLDYLDSLNVDVLWLTPFQSSTNYHGYDIKDYYSVDSRFGTLADYRKLVYEVHKRGMKIVMDFVLNHTSKANPWFVNSQNLVIVDKETGEELDEDPGKGKAIDYRQFYNWIDTATYKKLPAKKKEQWYGPLNGNGSKDDGYYFYSSFSSEMPELNYDYQPVRDAILDVCYYWMAFGLDGFRLDAVKHIYMQNEVEGVGKTVSDDVVPDKEYSVDRKRNINFYREFNARLKKVYPNAFVVGENLSGNTAETAPYYQGIDSQFDFNMYYDVARGMAQSTGAITQNGSKTDKGWIYGGATAYKTGLQNYTQYNSYYIGGQFTSNHDLPRARDRVNIKETVAGEGAINDKYYSFFKNNKVDGKASDVDTAKVSTTDVLLRMYYGFLLTIPGITWIYYGDELGMTGLMQYTVNSGSTSSTDSEPHEDMIYRQPMKWKASGNSEYEIGFDKKVEKLVGLNATSHVKSVEECSTVNSTTGKYTFTNGTLIDWVAKLTKIRRDYGLGKSTVTFSTSNAQGEIEYTVQGTKGTIYVSIAAQQNPAPSGGTKELARYTGTINGQTYGVLIKA